MKWLSGLILTLLLSACAVAPWPPSPDPTFASFKIRRVAVGPVAYATYQPNEPCTLFIDEDLRSAVVLELQRRGYDALASGASVPRSFAAGSPPPGRGDPPPAGLVPSAEGLLSVWIDTYWEHSPCGAFLGEQQYLTIGAVAVLYAGSPPVEVWRGNALVAEQGTYGASELIWLTTTRLTERLLGSLPAGSKWTKPP
jgi:hypothetical protein